MSDFSEHRFRSHKPFSLNHVNVIESWYVSPNTLLATSRDKLTMHDGATGSPVVVLHPYRIAELRATNLDERFSLFLKAHERWLDRRVAEVEQKLDRMFREDT